MKSKNHIENAKAIGDDSWELLNYTQLPSNASAARQIEALKADQDWQRNHHDEISRRIDVLIADIECTSDSAESAPGCSCRKSDAWCCAVDQNLSTVACTCSCHKNNTGKENGCQTGSK